jgi:hypothetical protein
MSLKNGVLTAIAIVLLVAIVYQYDPTFFGFMPRRREGFVATGEEEKEEPEEGFASGEGAMPGAMTGGAMMDGAMPGAMPGTKSGEPKAVASLMGGQKSGEGFADLASAEGPAAFASAEAPAGCYPRDQLTPTELLPADQNTIYAQQNPMGVGSLKGKNFLSAGALIGVNTVGQSLRNANLQLRSEPPNPQVPVSIFLQSTIGPDISHRPLEVGS